MLVGLTVETSFIIHSFDGTHSLLGRSRTTSVPWTAFSCGKTRWRSLGQAVTVAVSVCSPLVS